MAIYIGTLVIFSNASNKPTINVFNLNIIILVLDNHTNLPDLKSGISLYYEYQFNRSSEQQNSLREFTTFNVHINVFNWNTK